jgi:hypothetical protein
MKNLGKEVFFGTLFTVIGSLLGYALVGCSKPAAPKAVWRYACSTPMGDVQITPETDTNIFFSGNTLNASRAGKSIRIPFSSCVGVKGE